MGRWLVDRSGADGITTHRPHYTHLRAKSGNLSNRIHVVTDIVAIDVSGAVRGGVEAGEDGDEGGLAGAVMAQKYADLGGLTNGGGWRW